MKTVATAPQHRRQRSSDQAASVNATTLKTNDAALAAMTVAVIDELFVRIRSTGFFLRFTLFTRILLAAGFIPTGMVKLLGERFTTLPDTTPIGAFFESMYQTGLFWNFIGAVQVVAGVLLLIPRHAHLGALLFLPVIASINVINVALGFGLTTVITALMLLAALYLCCWDYDRFRSLFTTRPFEPRHRIRISSNTCG